MRISIKISLQNYNQEINQNGKAILSETEKSLEQSIQGLGKKLIQFVKTETRGIQLREILNERLFFINWASSTVQKEFRKKCSIIREHKSVKSFTSFSFSLPDKTELKVFQKAGWRMRKSWGKAMKRIYNRQFSAVETC